MGLGQKKLGPIGQKSKSQICFGWQRATWAGAMGQKIQYFQNISAA
jgi:hypothetical protein